MCRGSGRGRSPGHSLPPQIKVAAIESSAQHSPPPNARISTPPARPVIAAGRPAGGTTTPGRGHSPTTKEKRVAHKRTPAASSKTVPLVAQLPPRQHLPSRLEPALRRTYRAVTPPRRQSSENNSWKKPSTLHTLPSHAHTAACPHAHMIASIWGRPALYTQSHAPLHSPP